MKNVSTRWILILVLFGFASGVIAQAPTQIIRGKVIDQTSKESLIGAHITVLDRSETQGTISDLNGDFELLEVDPGRLRIQCDYLGYKSYVSPSLILNSAKQLFLEIAMEESAVTTGEVVIHAKTMNKKALNEMVLLSGRSFSVEETERYAGSIGDPSRMAVSFAGVQSTNDLDNDIIVRGNSAVGVLWRLEGIDIPNPNHFARRGSSGGGIGIFSVNMLSNSDFIYGSVPAEYGNTISSVFDMKFRKGNRDKTEYSFRAGILGLDFLSEGPLAKGRSSYIINYRYSTLGILNKAGIHVVGENTDNTFTDLAFHLNFPSKNQKNIIQLWGIGGYSSELHSPIDSIENWKEFDDLTRTDFKTHMGVVGMNITHLLGNNSYLTGRLAFMGDHITHDKDTLDLNMNLGTFKTESYTTQRLTASVEYVRKVNSRFSYEIGSKANFLGYDLKYSGYDRVLQSLMEYINEDEGIGGQYLIQAYIQSSWKPTPRFNVSGGLHFLHFSLNTNQIVEPRIALSYHLNQSTQLSLAYGHHSQLVPLGSHFTHENNINLPLMKSQHLTAGLSRSFGSKYKVTLELYYQDLSDIPIAVDASQHYWMLNDLVGYSKYELAGLGKGKNYGIDLTLERFFDQGFFFIAAGSVYKSEYALESDEFFNSKYAGNFNTSLMLGKELEFNNGNTLQLGFRNLLYGGQRYKRADETITQRIREYHDEDASTLNRQNKNYWRTDIRAAYRKNLSSHAWSLSLDIQNLLNIDNTRGEIWNFADESFEPKSQAGLIPVLTFQVDF